MNIKYLYIIIFFTQITTLKSQTDVCPIGGYWTMGVNTQFYIGRRHLSDALIALPRQGSYFEWGADLYRSRRWWLTGSAGLMLVKLASNQLVLRTTDQITGNERTETLKNPLFRVGASITVGLVYRVRAIF